MDVYELGVGAEPLFAFLSDVGNLPKYLPPIHEARPEPGERIALEGQAPDGNAIHNSGYYRVDGPARRMEWGADLEHAYSGWLQVVEDGAERSSLTVHLELGPRSPQDELQAEAGPDRDPAEEALGATFASIRSQVEGDGGKVQPPPL